MLRPSKQLLLPRFESAHILQTNPYRLHQQVRISPAPKETAKDSDSVLTLTPFCSYNIYAEGIEVV